MEFYRITINGRVFNSLESAAQFLIETGQHEILEELRQFVSIHARPAPLEYIETRFSPEADIQVPVSPLLKDIKTCKTVNGFLKKIRRQR